MSNVEDREINSRKRHRQSLALAKMFWHRWRREYLPGLIIRPKRTSETRNLAENDVVLLVEANTPRDPWPLGYVVQVHPSEDGRVRKVDVKTQCGSLIPPVTKLCLLEEAAMSHR